jgi:hypothetical protein
MIVEACRIDHSMNHLRLWSRRDETGVLVVAPSTAGFWVAQSSTYQLVTDFNWFQNDMTRCWFHLLLEAFG